MNLPVYMDYHATTPCDPRVLEAMLPYFSQHFGNAASQGHAFGWHAAEAVKIAREEIASLLNADPSEIIFTSGATESINLAIKGVFETMAGKGRHIITIATEHRAALDTCGHLEKLGAEVTYLPVQTDGLIDPGLLQAAIRPDTILIAAMYANNETGVIQPIQTISKIARQEGIFFFTDATQAVGKIPVNVMDDGIDLLACSAHKIYGPKGVGALSGIVGFGKAAGLRQAEMEQDLKSVSRLRDKLEKAILNMGGTELNGHILNRLPTVTNISFAQGVGNQLLKNLLKVVAVSSGSACSSASPEPSHVLKAMGLDDAAAYHAIRFSLGKYNTEEEVEFVIQRVRLALEEVNSEKVHIHDGLQT
jgi:cysteine desulfurase